MKSKQLLTALTLGLGLILVLWWIFAFGVAPVAHAAGSWYVSPGGNDGNTCTSPGTACATLNGALIKTDFVVGDRWLVWAPQAQTQALSGTIKFVSDPTWAVYSATGEALGFAQTVCVNPSAPPNCPAGATLYNSVPGGSRWSANLSSIPGATWIWAPGIIGTTSPAFPAQFVFSKAFTLSGTSITGTISVAVDDFAEVSVNGASVGAYGSLTNVSDASAAQKSLANFDITSFLVTGVNVITIRAANGPFGYGTGPYGCNPAGVVFGGTLHSLSFIYLPIVLKNS